MAEITKELKLNRVKQASDAYKELKAIHAATNLSELFPPEAGEKDEPNPTLPVWPVFRDDFIEDWTSNRVVKTDKEADAHFDKEAEEALEALEANEVAPTVLPPTTPMKTVRS